MKAKFQFLYMDSLCKRVGTKTFIISNIILLITTILVSNIGHIINLFGGDFKKSVYIELEVAGDEGNNIYDAFIANIEENNKTNSIKFEILTREKAEEDEDLEASYEIKYNVLEDKVEVEYGYHTSNVQKGVIVDALISDSYMDYMRDKDTELFIAYDKIASAIQINEVDLRKDNEKDDDIMHAISIISMVVSMITFFIIIMSIQTLSGEIIEEKQSKMIETVIANVSPKVHIFTKVLATLTFGVTQILLLAGYGFIGVQISGIISTLATSTGAFDINGEMAGAIMRQTGGSADITKILLVIGVFTILGIALYTILIAVASAMATSIQDAAQFQTPVMMLLVVAFYLGMGSDSLDGAVFIKVCGYIPFFSPILAPMLYFTGTMVETDIIIAVLILIAIIFVITKYGFIIYKVSILDYSDDKLIPKLKKAIKKAKADKKVKVKN